MKKNKFKGKVTNTGYLDSSPDKNNDFNVIPSNQITMEGVSQNIFGIDNLGNIKIMTPGNNYTFPGSQVLEIPMAQKGKLTKTSNIIEPINFVDLVNNLSKVPFIPLKDSDIHIEDNRSIRATSGKPINPNKDLKTGKYSKNRTIQTIQAARKEGVDPYTMLAVALAETGIGKNDDNIGHVLGNENYTGDAYADMAKTFKQKTDKAAKLGIKDEATAIQIFNGLGKLFPNTEADYDGGGDRYGVKIPKSGLSMKKNPLYGKEIINLRDSVLKQSPVIQSLVNSYEQGGLGNIGDEIDLTDDELLYYQSLGYKFE